MTSPTASATDDADLIARLRVESLRLFPARLRDGFAYHDLAHLLDKAADRLEACLMQERVLREALTPSAETKAAYIGEFSFEIEEGEYGYRVIPVAWTTIKEIMAAIRNHALTIGKQMGEAE